MEGRGTDIANNEHDPSKRVAVGSGRYIHQVLLVGFASLALLSAIGVLLLDVFRAHRVDQSFKGLVVFVALLLPLALESLLVIP